MFNSIGGYGFFIYGGLNLVWFIWCIFFCLRRVEELGSYSRQAVRLIGLRKRIIEVVGRGVDWGRV